MTTGVQRAITLSRWTPRASWVLVVALLALATGAAGVQAQGTKGKKSTPEQEKILGKITQAEMKGKAAQLTIEKEDGETLELLVTPKMKVNITAPGDASMLQSKVFVSTSSAVESNNELFAHKFDVYAGNTAPAAGIQRDPNAAEVYQLGGTIVAAEKDAILVNVGGGQRKVTFEQGAVIEVQVHTNQLELIREGSAVELEGNTRGAKFLPTRVTVRLENPLTPDEIAGKREKKPRETTKTAAKGKKGAKPSKTGDDPESPAGEVDPDDPFGFNKGKKKEEKPAGEKEPGDKPSE